MTDQHTVLVRCMAFRFLTASLIDRPVFAKVINVRSFPSIYFTIDYNLETDRHISNLFASRRLQLPGCPLSVLLTLYIFGVFKVNVDYEVVWERMASNISDNVPHFDEPGSLWYRFYTITDSVKAIQL